MYREWKREKDKLFKILINFFFLFCVLYMLFGVFFDIVDIEILNGIIF